MWPQTRDNNDQITPHSSLLSHNLQFWWFTSFEYIGRQAERSVHEDQLYHEEGDGEDGEKETEETGLHQTLSHALRLL